MRRLSDKPNITLSVRVPVDVLASKPPAESASRWLRRLARAAVAASRVPQPTDQANSDRLCADCACRIGCIWSEHSRETIRRDALKLGGGDCWQPLTNVRIK
jgi:hypothetical protein